MSLEHGGFAITVDDIGRFTTTVKGFELTAETYGGLKAKIDATLRMQLKEEKLNLPAIVIIQPRGLTAVGGMKLFETAITGINRANGSITYAPKPPSGWELWSAGYVGNAFAADTPENRVILTSFIKAKGAFDAAAALRASISIPRPHGGNVEVSRYPGMLESLRKCYEASKKGGSLK